MASRKASNLLRRYTGGGVHRLCNPITQIAHFVVFTRVPSIVISLFWIEVSQFYQCWSSKSVLETSNNPDLG